MTRAKFVFAVVLAPLIAVETRHASAEQDAQAPCQNAGFQTALRAARLKADAASIRGLVRRYGRDRVAATLAWYVGTLLGIEGASGNFLEGFPTDVRGLGALFDCSLQTRDLDFAGPFKTLVRLAQDGNQKAVGVLFAAGLNGDGAYAEILCDGLAAMVTERRDALLRYARESEGRWCSLKHCSQALDIDSVRAVLRLLKDDRPADRGDRVFFEGLLQEKLSGASN